MKKQENLFIFTYSISISFSTNQNPHKTTTAHWEMKKNYELHRLASQALASMISKTRTKNQNQNPQFYFTSSLLRFFFVVLFFQFNKNSSTHHIYLIFLRVQKIISFNEEKNRMKNCAYFFLFFCFHNWSPHSLWFIQIRNAKKKKHSKSRIIHEKYQTKNDRNFFKFSFKFLQEL